MRSHLVTLVGCRGATGVKSQFLAARVSPVCSIIAALGVWPGKPLVIAANRDEALDRPASPPAVWPVGEVAVRRVLAPRDLKAGGTWLGFNDAELFVGITNRRKRPDPNRRSRGELVFAALGAASPAEAAARIRALDPRDYNPFHLLMADRSGGQVIWGDGEAFHELALETGRIHWVTERSYGAGPSKRHTLLEHLAETLPKAPAPSAEQWRGILAEHGLGRRGGPERPMAMAIRLDALCVHAKPLNYGTRSSTFVELGDERGDARFLHAHGRPCETEWFDHSADVAELLAV